MSNVSNIVKSIQDIMRKDAGTYGDAQRLEQLGWMFFLKIFDDHEKELELLRDNYKSPLPNQLRWSAWATDEEGITGEALLDFVNSELLPKLKSLASGADKIAGLIRMTFEDANNYMKNGTLMRQVINRVNGIDFNASDDRHMFGDIYEKILKDLQSAGNSGEFYTPRAVTQFIVEQVNPRLGETILDPACGTGGFLVCAIEHLRKQAKTEADERTIQECFSGIEKKHLPHVLCMTNLLLHGIDVPSNVRHDNTLSRPLRDWSPKERVDVIVTNPPFGGMEEDGIEANFPAEFRTRETADLFLVLLMKILKPGGRAGLVLPDGTLFGEGVKTRIKEALLTECNLHTIVRLPNGVFNPYTGIRTNLLFFTKGQPTTDVWYYEHPYPSGAKSYNKGKPIRIEEFEGERAWWESRVENDKAWRVSIEQIKANNYNLDLKNPRQNGDIPGDVGHLLPEYEKLLAQIAAMQTTLKNQFEQAFRGSRPVGSQGAPIQLFFDKFARFAEGPSAVPKLRELALQLAFSGAFTSDRRDQPLGDDLIVDGAPVLPSIPSSWTWMRGGDTFNVIRGVTYKKDDATDCPTEGYIPLLRANNIDKALNFDDLVYVPQSNVRKDQMIRRGDIVIAMSSGSKKLVGKAAQALEDFDGGFGAFCGVVRNRGEIADDYLARYFLSPQYTSWVTAAGRGIGINNLSKGDLDSLPIPTPAPDEQRRIVEKVDQLMRLLDQMELQLAVSRARADKLLEAMFAELTAEA
jgi:type I restriction enzyme M protein